MPVAHNKTHRITAIVGDRKRVDLKIADGDLIAGLKFHPGTEFTHFLLSTPEVSHIAVDRHLDPS